MYGNAAEALSNAPLLFTLEELDKCDTKHKRPSLKYFENPKNDNEQLFNLQNKYYEARNNGEEKKADFLYWEMWQLTAKVAERIIKKIVIARGLEFAPDEISDKVSDTCEYLIRRFKTRPNYAITTNWIIAIRDSVRHALDYQTDLDEKTDVLGDFSLINNGSIKSICGRRIEDVED